MRNRREVRRVGLHKKPVVGHHLEERVVRPFPECHDAAERHEPAGGQANIRQRRTPRVTVQHAAHAGRGGLSQQRRGVVFRLARVDDHGTLQFVRKLELRAKGRNLLLARRVIVVIVQPTLADGHRAISHTFANGREVTGRVELVCVVRVNARRVNRQKPG